MNVPGRPAERASRTALLALEESVVRGNVLWMRREGDRSWRPVPRPVLHVVDSSDLDGAPDEERLERELTLAFAPLHKRAFGTAVGLVGGLVVFALTWLHVLADPLPAEAPDLGLLAQFFAGYSVSPAGSLVGFGWGVFTGFVAGWFVAFCRNLVIALSIFLTRARAEFHATRDFLDHI